MARIKGVFLMAAGRHETEPRNGDPLAGVPRLSLEPLDAEALLALTRALLAVRNVPLRLVDFLRERRMAFRSTQGS